MDALKPELCQMCYNKSEKNYSVPMDDINKIFRNCFTYLHSSLTTDLSTKKISQTENYLPFCKHCFNSSWELNQLAENLQDLQKQISDLSVTFSLAVFYRRSQAEDEKRQNRDSRDNTNFCGVSEKQTIELNVSCLPPYQFPIQNMQQNSSHSQSHNTEQQSQTESNKNDVAQNLHNITEIGQLNRNCNKYLHTNSLSHEPIETERPDLFTNLFYDGGHRRGNNPAISHPVINVENDVVCEKPTQNQYKVGDDCSTARIISDKTDPKGCYTNQSQYWKRKRSDSESDSSCDTKTSCRTFSPNTEEMRPPVPMFSVGITGTPTGYNKNAIPKDESDYEEKPFGCSFCRKRFKVSTDAKIHERIHTGSKPYKCFYCDKSFAQISHRTVHQRIHTGEKPYKCSYCEKTFSQSCNKKIHEERNHGREAVLL